MDYQEKIKPVLFLGFNRPDTSALVFDAIKKAAPGKLYISLDGPRNKNDKDKIEELIDLIKNKINWKCQVQWLRQDKNLGCSLAITTGINWFFSKENMGIILEDDCVPNKSFFNFCSELLDYHKNNDNVGHISGYNCQNNIIRGEGTYYASNYFHVWGWATWKRAWSGYDLNVDKFYEMVNNNDFNKYFKRKSIANYWKRKLKCLSNGSVNTWDYQWAFHNLYNNRFALNSNYSLVQNVGFGRDDAAHTKKNNKEKIEIKEFENMIHPSALVPDLDADDFTYKNHLHKGVMTDIKFQFRRWFIT